MRSRRKKSEYSGTGLLGFIIANECGAQSVVLSDYAPVVLDNLRHNVQVNVQNKKIKDGQVSVRRIDWEDMETYPNTPFDVITCADCLYDPAVIPPLVRLGE